MLYLLWLVPEASAKVAKDEDTGNVGGGGSAGIFIWGNLYFEFQVSENV